VRSRVAAAFGARGSSVPGGDDTDRRAIQARICAERRIVRERWQRLWVEERAARMEAEAGATRLALELVASRARVRWLEETLEIELQRGRMQRALAVTAG
jgi:hypothetical protein